MVTGTILSVQLAYPSLQVEVAFSDDGGQLPDPTHLVYNIPAEQPELMTQDAINQRIQGDAANFENLLNSVSALQPNVDASITSAGTVTLSKGIQTTQAGIV